MEKNSLFFMPLDSTDGCIPDRKVSELLQKHNSIIVIRGVYDFRKRILELFNESLND